MVLAFMSHIIPLGIYHVVGFYESSHLIGENIMLLAFMCPLISLVYNIMLLAFMCPLISLVYNIMLLAFMSRLILLVYNIMLLAFMSHLIALVFMFYET